MADVVFQVEALVLHPVGIVQPEGRVLQPTTEQRSAAQAGAEVADDVLVPHQTVGRGTLVANPQAAPDHGLMGSVGIEELGVQGGQLFHGLPPPIA